MRVFKSLFVTLKTKGRLTCKSFSIRIHAIVFLAEIYAIKAYAMKNIEKY